MKCDNWFKLSGEALTRDFAFVQDSDSSCTCRCTVLCKIDLNDHSSCEVQAKL